MKINVFEESKNIRVLVLEDSPEDAELMLDELEKGGFIVDAKVTDNENNFTYELMNFNPDIILADYSLPRITGIEALSIVMRKFPEAPFIFITGTVGEEIAAETILNGASGLVLKSNITKLPIVVKDIFSKGGRWHSKRLEQASRRIQNRIQHNIEALNRIQEFIKSNATPAISTDLDNTLSDLKKLHKDLTNQDN